MSELLIRPSEHEASSDTAKIPSKEEQAEFFKSVLAGVDARQDPTLRKHGPLVEEFRPIFNWIDEQVKTIDPTFTPDVLFPSSYQSEELKKYLREGGHQASGKLNAIADDRIKLLLNFANEQLLPILKTQTLPEDAIDAPPYASQSNVLACSAACFRMLFEATAGWQPMESVIIDRLVDEIGGTLVDDTVYHKVFETEAFKSLASRKVTTIDIIGADFTSVQRLLQN